MLNEKGTKAKALQIDFPNGEIPQKGEKFEIFKILKIFSPKSSRLWSAKLGSDIIFTFYLPFIPSDK